ncbi:MAG: hypothetical protein OEW24_03365 [Chloroflexota bacterium]|nr:hypothetical protein [Chloroflexota bacterium]
MSSIGTAEASWETNESVRVFYVPGCRAQVLLDTYMADQFPAQE